MYQLIDGINEDEQTIEVILRINRICNQKCIFCFTDIDNKTNFSLLEIKSTIDHILKEYDGKKISITLSGGEPTLHNDFFQILDYCDTNKIYVLLQTNGVFFSLNSNIKKIKKYKNLELFISFHSHIDKIYNLLTNSNSYSLAVKGIKNLYENQIKIELNIVLNIFNYKYIGEYLVFINNLFNKSIKVNISIMSSIKKYSYCNKILFRYSDVISKINTVSGVIKNNVIISNNFGGECDFPYCIGEKLFYFNRITVGKNNFGIGDNRFKIDRCERCYYNNVCRGITIEYRDVFGFDEFESVEY